MLALWAADPSHSSEVGDPGPIPRCRWLSLQTPCSLAGSPTTSRSFSMWPLPANWTLCRDVPAASTSQRWSPVQSTGRLAKRDFCDKWAVVFSLSMSPVSHRMYLYSRFPSFIWSSLLTGHLVFLFAHSGNPHLRGFLLPEVLTNYIWLNIFIFNYI